MNNPELHISALLSARKAFIESELSNKLKLTTRKNIHPSGNQTVKKYFISVMILLNEGALEKN